jgi:hypothetical protein
MGGGWSEGGRDITVDQAFNIYTTGIYDGPGDYDPGTGNYTMFAPGGPGGGIYEVFVSKLCGILTTSNTTTPGNMMICAGNTTTLSAITTGSLNWYATSTSTISLGSGLTFITPALSPGTYTYYMQAANSCTTDPTRTPVTLTVNALPIINAGVLINPVCGGSIDTLQGSGNANTYTWTAVGVGATQAVSPTVTTTYTLTGTDSSTGCTNSAQVTVSVNPQPTITVVTSSSIICTMPVQQSATLTAGGASSYTWNTTAISASIVVSPGVTTVYTVTGTDVNGCINTIAITQSVSACTGISPAETDHSKISIYPNPFVNKLSISSWIHVTINVQVLNSQGEIIYSGKMENGKLELDLSNYSAGIYFIRFPKNESAFKMQKVIKQ